MLGDPSNIIQMILTAIIPLILAITVHEAAHGWVARRCGDNTAASLGRVTLNPIKHIDPLGTVIIPLILLKLGGFLFGWAKPVPVNWHNLKHPRRDKALVAIAGPAANLLMAIIWAALASIITNLNTIQDPFIFNSVRFFSYACSFGIQINLILCFLNLLPIPPLDGSRILASCLKSSWTYQYERLEPYGIWILLALILVGVITKLLLPILQYSTMTLYTLFGLN